MSRCRSPQSRPRLLGAVGGGSAAGLRACNSINGARNTSPCSCGTEATPLGPLVWNAAQNSLRQLGRPRLGTSPKAPWRLRRMPASRRRLRRLVPKTQEAPGRLPRLPARSCSPTQRWGRHRRRRRRRLRRLLGKSQRALGRLRRLPATQLWHPRRRRRRRRRQPRWSQAPRVPPLAFLAGVQGLELLTAMWSMALLHFSRT